MCGAKTEGVDVGSSEFTFVPGGHVKGGSFAWDIGTAGSTTMLALGILPLACFAAGPVVARITGGVFQDFAPSPHHMGHVLRLLLKRMGITMEIETVRAGYAPKGAGIIELRVKPLDGRLRPADLTNQGSIAEVSGIAFSSHLEERAVSERMARVCEERLARAGLRSKIQRIYDRHALHAGASLTIWAESTTGCVLGAGRAGAPRRTSETIGRSVAENFLEDLAAGATVDRHAADQLVLFAALADGTSRYLVPRQTEHLQSNLWLAEKFGAELESRGNRITIRGLGFLR